VQHPKGGESATSATLTAAQRGDTAEAVGTGRFSWLSSSFFSKSVTAPPGKMDKMDVQGSRSGSGPLGGRSSKEQSERVKIMQKFDKRSGQDPQKKMKIYIARAPLSEYGPPRYGLTYASWTLLLLTRCALEDLIVNILQIDIDFFGSKPVQDDDYFDIVHGLDDRGVAQTPLGNKFRNSVRLSDSVQNPLYIEEKKNRGSDGTVAVKKTPTPISTPFNRWSR